MKSRTLHGNLALGFFVASALFIALAFGTSSWLVSDKGARVTNLGLWTHCFKWLPDPTSQYDRRFLVGCQEEIRGFSMPAYNRRIMTVTQVFFTIAFISVLAGVVMATLYFFCWGPEHKRHVQMIRGLAYDTLVGGVCAGLAVIIFAAQMDRYVWMPFDYDNAFGWSFVVACLGAITLITSAILFFMELNLHARQRRYVKETVHVPRHTAV